MTGATRHASFRLSQVAQRHFAGADGLRELPNTGPRSDDLTAEPPVQHWTTGEHDCRNVTAGSAHQQSRSCFVATRHQDNPIDWIPPNRFLDIHTCEVAKQHGSRAKVGFSQRHDREFERNTAGLPYAIFYLLGEFPEMGVTRCELGESVTNADNGATVESVIGETLVPHPASVDNDVAAKAAEPTLGAQRWRGGGCHERWKVALLRENCICWRALAKRRVGEWAIVAGANQLRGWRLVVRQGSPLWLSGTPFPPSPARRFAGPPVPLCA